MTWTKQCSRLRTRSRCSNAVRYARHNPPVKELQGKIVFTTCIFKREIKKFLFFTTKCWKYYLAKQVLSTWQSWKMKSASEKKCFLARKIPKNVQIQSLTTNMLSMTYYFTSWNSWYASLLLPPRQDREQNKCLQSKNQIFKRTKSSFWTPRS